MAQENPNCSNKLNEKDSGKIDEKSHEFLRKLYYFIGNYEGQLPNLRDIFRPEAVEWLLTESVKSDTLVPRPLVNFVVNTGYKDEPDVGEDAKPSMRRTTPIHHATRKNRGYLTPDLFKIYDRCDVNYTDEDGLTHFHVVCEYGCDDIVEKFLEHGVDPNFLEQGTDYSPLHLALINDSEQVFKLLLRSGADPNLANAEGCTPLHMICRNKHYDEYAIWLFEMSHEKYHPINVGAVDKSGDTPLHLAVAEGHCKAIEFLLKAGRNRRGRIDSTACYLQQRQIRQQCRRVP
ncbi:26S proteasome non-ATPase regulatory subunit 10-like [Trichogramma pretiosum]|uniref:26S proteasome non-ATPase regulatory subunit 10-like n=1 Tax=Trichogramma pretiosum TaxID=7493 RepID=UPI0006C9B664|nr:26S proteasome non-ATPase regulatory subunit 10-like [Trichogramma pretiosum]